MNRAISLHRCSLIAILQMVLIAWGATFASAADPIEAQRDVFRSVFQSVERGDWSAVDNLSSRDRAHLKSYVLWPDLRATWLRANIKKIPAADIEPFLQHYGALRPARELRYRLALNKAGNGDLAGFLSIYEKYYQGQEIEKLDCLALEAELAAGRGQRVVGRALDLWLVGKSQTSECDPVFDYLLTQNVLGVFEHQKRFDLAIDSRAFTLARWLAKKIDPRHVDAATQWTQAQENPEDFLRNNSRQGDSELLREQLVYATERLTFRDPVVASQLWARISKRYAFSQAQRLRTLRHIALWTARDKLPGAYDLLTSLPAAAQNDEVLRWRARTSLQRSDWQTMLTDISLMSDEERATEEWQYWRAIALLRGGQILAANAKLEALSLERSYYGFLAADEIGKHYTLDDAELLADEATIAALRSREDVIRARELYYVGQDGRGRSEWDAVTRYLSTNEKIQAAILAHRWGWHSRAIATAASLGEYDDLTLRYPLPYKASFEKSSSQASIPATWAYGIARSESLFMRDVRSSAGAIGLMQLMPATGREVAKDLSLPYSGLTTLTDPESNIRLGTRYLSQMAQRYQGNQVLATAAYNAGPHRVDRWLPENGTVDARVWIENIPFNETRGYVKRVLAAQTIFHWRMTGKIRRLSNELATVRAQPAVEQLASH